MRRVVGGLVVVFVAAGCSGDTATSPESLTLEPASALLTGPPTASSATYDEIEGLLLGLESDFDKYYDRGNKAAGVRIVAGLSDLIPLVRRTAIAIQRDRHTQAMGGRPPQLDTGDRFDQLMAALTPLEPDFVSYFDKGNKAAAVRLVDGLRDLEALARAVQQEVRRG